uniref:GCK domain-containing protein n=1 Tax=Noccaea caerulescens TaxID=107243 RepID=A0A1J3H8M4_NOCCA
MGSANSVSMAFSDEDSWANQGQFSQDGEESRTLIEDSKEKEKAEADEEEEEESGECGLCTFIKGGECKEAWIALEKCVEEEAEEESDASKCSEVRLMFKTCIFDNPVYYEPVIAGQAKVVARMLSELEAEKEAILNGEAAAIAKALNKLRTEEQPLVPAEAAAIAKAYRELEAEKKEEADVSKGNE